MRLKLTTAETDSRLDCIQSLALRGFLARLALQHSFALDLLHLRDRMNANAEALALSLWSQAH